MVTTPTVVRRREMQLLNGLGEETQGSVMNFRMVVWKMWQGTVYSGVIN